MPSKYPYCKEFLSLSLCVCVCLAPSVYLSICLSLRVSLATPAQLPQLFFPAPLPRSDRALSEPPPLRRRTALSSRCKQVPRGDAREVQGLLGPPEQAQQLSNLSAAVAAAEEDGEEGQLLYGCQVALMRLYHLHTGSSKHLGGVVDL